MNKKYDFNDSFFEEINDEKKAYALGLIYSDGNIFHKEGKGYYVTFGQQEERKDIVYKLNEILDSNAPIHKALRGSKLFYYIRLTSKKMYEDLTKWGITSNKSLTVKFPTNMPKLLMNHFIRGLFDGDGCIWNGQRKKMLVREWGKERIKTVHNVKFTYTGNDDFVNSLQNLLVEELGIKKTKLNYSKAKNKSNTTSENICTMEYSGRGNIQKLYNYLYNNSTIFLDEKKYKFEAILSFHDEKL